MKHLKKFESFAINEEEGLIGGVKKFFTGHESSEAKKEAKDKFMISLSEAESELKSNPSDYPQSDNWEPVKQKLIKQAEENNFNGSLKTQQSSRNGGLYIIYKDGSTGMKNLASGASSRTANPLG